MEGVGFVIPLSVPTFAFGRHLRCKSRRKSCPSRVEARFTKYGAGKTGRSNEVALMLCCRGLPTQNRIPNADFSLAHDGPGYGKRRLPFRKMASRKTRHGKGQSGRTLGSNELIVSTTLISEFSQCWPLYWNYGSFSKTAPHRKKKRS